MALLTFDFGSPTLNRNERLYVIIPEDFIDSDPVENNQKKFPTLYLFHGYFGNATDWMRWSSIERYAAENHVAVVMPSAYNSYYTNELYGYDYFDYIANEVPSFLRRLLPLSSDPKFNYIAGLSMGGYGAMKVGLTYPERYSFVASLSGALDIDFMYQRSMLDSARVNRFISIFGENADFTDSKNNLFVLAKDAKEKAPYLYINCGTEDFLFDSNNLFVEHLKKLSIPHVYETYPGEHSWSYWDTHIQNVFLHIKKSKNI